MIPSAATTPVAAPDHPDVVRALEFYLAALEAGRPPDRAALLADYPHVAGPLADCLDGLELLRRAAADDPPRPAPDGRLGDYRLIRTLGRGGMGTVYDAEHVRTGERVAVKVLTAAGDATPAERRRFRHEIQAAALLDHPHIVPVLDVGTDRGVEFFAMRRIDGPSLADPAARPADPAGVARLLLQAADALAHAHAAGVVHRDVKPGNLLVGPGGHLWVADFGLAFVPGASRLTRPAAAVGTLRYMSPEQADPGRGVVDHRADLYGLGATGYELLTGRPPFDDGDDRGAFVRRLLDTDPAPPRAVNPAIPRRLETVILKLLAKDPARRYRSMDELAADLRRFLAGRAVTARRPTAVDRGLAWADRHRRLTAGVAAAVGLVVAGAVGLLRWQNAAIARERDEADRAVDAMYTHFAERVLAREPGQEERHREFLQLAAEHYERRAAAGADRLAAAAAWRRAADAAGHLGRLADAGRAYDRAVELLDALDPADPRARRERAVAHNDRGNWHRNRGASAAAGRDYRTAADLLAGLLVEGSADPFDPVAAAGVENNIGLLAAAAGDAAEAERRFRAARGRYARLALDRPDRTDHLCDAGMCSHNLAETLRAAGRAADAEAAAREAVALHERSAVADPDSPARRCELARSRLTLGELLAAGRRPDAAAVLAAAADGWRRLAADFPRVPAYRAGAGRAATALAAAAAAR
jgi:tetratricopeptide (TPR) repeat protein/predicted Ser/Thr protein kinase